MFVKRSIVHKDHLPWFQRCNEGLFHPGIENFAIGGIIIDTFGNGLAIDLPGDDVRPLKFLPSHNIQAPSSPLLIWHSGISPVQMAIDSILIHIDYVFLFVDGHCPLILLTFLLIPFFIGPGLFLL
jgi:hypothetical protein